MKHIIFCVLACALTAEIAWAFPDTTVLDTFTRANENPVSGGGNWAGPVVSGQGQLKVVSNALLPPATGPGSSYWNASTFGSGSTVEVYVTVTTASASDSSDYGLWIHTNTEGAAGLDGYQLYIWQQTGVFHWRFYRFDNNSGTFLGGADVGSQAISSGDSIGLSITSAGVLQGWYKASGGSWATSGATRTDTTYTSGHIGIYKGFNDTTTVMDNFGGGNVAASRRPVAPILFSWLLDLLTPYEAIACCIK